MSCQSPTSTANAVLSGDPTDTLGTRREFIADLKRRARDLRGRIRRKIGYETDALHLKTDAPGGGLTPNQAGEDRFEFITDQNRREAFRRWLREQINEALLDPARRADVLAGDHWTAAYIRDGYVQGWNQAEGRLMQAGVSVSATSSAEIAAITQLTVPQEQLRGLYARTFENLEGITDDMARTIRQEMVRGVAEGVNPREMAGRMNDEIDTISRTRLNTLARTEVINSHSTAALDRYERAGVDTVKHGEWTTAGDNRVCPICQSLEGRTFTIQRLREGTFSFDASGEDVADSLAGSYRLKPPAHPNGRCTIIPVVT